MTRVIKLEQKDVDRAYPCITEGPNPWEDGLGASRQWLQENLGRTVEGLHLEDDQGNVIGHVFYGRVGQALVPYKIEDNMAILLCEWVHIEHQRKGYGRQLFEAFVDVLWEEGYKGVLVDASDFQEYMHHEHFAKRGFWVVDQEGPWRLMYFPVRQESVAVERLQPSLPPPGLGTVEVALFRNHFCPVMASTYAKVDKVVAEFGDKVALKEYPVTQESLARYGRADGLFIAGKEKTLGPASEEEIRRAIAEELPKE
jgi:predicted N-acetyltransferase YhbS